MYQEQLEQFGERLIAMYFYEVKVMGNKIQFEYFQTRGSQPMNCEPLVEKLLRNEQKLRLVIERFILESSSQTFNKTNGKLIIIHQCFSTKVSQRYELESIVFENERIVENRLSSEHV
jgi:hypothetical protein